MVQKPAPINPLQGLSLQDILGLLPLDAVRQSGFQLTEEDHQRYRERVQRRLEARLKARFMKEKLSLLEQREAVSRVIIKMQIPIVQAYNRGLDLIAFSRWLVKQQEGQNFSTPEEFEVWLDRLTVPDSLKGKIKRPLNLPPALELLKAFQGYEERFRRVSKKRDRFPALLDAFPDLDIRLLKRFEQQPFDARQFAKEVLAEDYRYSVTTIERRLTSARKIIGQKAPAPSAQMAKLRARLAEALGQPAGGGRGNNADASDDPPA